MKTYTLQIFLLISALIVGFNTYAQYQPNRNVKNPNTFSRQDQSKGLIDPSFNQVVSLLKLSVAQKSKLEQLKSKYLSTVRILQKSIESSNNQLTRGLTSGSAQLFTLNTYITNIYKKEELITKEWVKLLLAFQRELTPSQKALFKGRASMLLDRK